MSVSSLPTEIIDDLVAQSSYDPKSRIFLVSKELYNSVCRQQPVWSERFLETIESANFIGYSLINAAEKGAVEFIKSKINQTYYSYDIYKRALVRSKGQEEIVRLICGKIDHLGNATINILIENASRNGHEGTLVFLFEKFVKKNKDFEFDSFYMSIIFAARNGHTGIVKFLIDHTADHTADVCLNRRRIDGLEMALFYAAERGHEEIVQLLLELPEHAPRADCMNSQAITFARKNGHTGIVQLLMKQL
jgi:hypothetical protein